jgi:hypothetical protein
MSFDFEDLRSHFQIVRKQFEEAETLEAAVGGDLSTNYYDGE